MSSEPRTIRGPCFDECERGIHWNRTQGTHKWCKCQKQEAHAETAESLAFRLETERLQMGKDVERLTKERDGLLTQVQDMRAEIERLKKPRQHPVKVGESVRRTTEGSIAPIGTLGRVLVVWSDAYQVELRKGFSTMWAFDDCTPCDPPPEASHDTPEGKQAAESVIRDDRKTEPKPGDTVRLVRVPTCNDYGHAWILEWGAVGNMGKVCKIRSYPFGNVAVVDIDARLSYEWPLSCVEVVKGGDK